MFNLLAVELALAAFLLLFVWVTGRRVVGRQEQHALARHAVVVGLFLGVFLCSLLTIGSLLLHTGACVAVPLWLHALHDTIVFPAIPVLASVLFWNGLRNRRVHRRLSRTFMILFVAGSLTGVPILLYLSTCSSNNAISSL